MLHSTDQLHLLAPRHSFPLFSPLLLQCLHQMRLGDRPYLRPWSSAVMLIYGSITPQLVQTEARSSLIRELRLCSWELRQHADMCEREHAWMCVCVCVSAFNIWLNFQCFLYSPNMELNGDKSNNSQIVFELLLTAQ